MVSFLKTNVFSPREEIEPLNIAILNIGEKLQVNSKLAVISEKKKLRKSKFLTFISKISKSI